MTLTSPTGICTLLRSTVSSLSSPDRVRGNTLGELILPYRLSDFVLATRLVSLADEDEAPSEAEDWTHVVALITHLWAALGTARSRDRRRRETRPGRSPRAFSTFSESPILIERKPTCSHRSSRGAWR